MTPIEGFLQVLRPDRKRYVISRQGGRDYEEKGFLSVGLIEAYYRGSVKLAYFSSGAVRDYVGIDVDDHKKKGGKGGWLGKVPTRELVEKVDEVLHRMRVEPSARFKSPQGLHLYWFLDRALPNEVLDEVMRPIVEGLAEHLPTPRHALRIPRPQMLRDEFYEAVEFPGFENLRRVRVEEVFGDATKPEVLAAKAKARAAQRRLGGVLRMGPNPVKNIEQAEAVVGLLKDGDTNGKYKRLVGVYFANGLTMEQAIGRFEALIDRSTEYTGPLRMELERRVKSSYGRMKPPASGSGQAFARLLQDPKAIAVVRSIVEAVGLPPKSKSREPLERILWGLWARKLENDEIVGDPARLALQDYKYPGYRRLLREGYYPVSSKDLHRWNARYPRYLGMLIGVGVLAESPYRYSTNRRCKHYALNLNAFTVLRGHRVTMEGSLRVVRVG